ncbi:fumarylacetoacetate hydrolase family protein [Falsiroseomonas selenitidurans]|uniref:Fumarylacetoacetate hydrolase family protein n=1 Tax=Falsiroseomonas selenitidurans TaxID=2716335 RepID=A0ABX1E0Z8_9PROT|nr:fumarylacetoacetate hydrolase family protein [Falsiroseomonas selenitidurans]NKC30768.1 fumarylacetoacetate hydrolase family protein [Falsiroseomonas selenitidurans]
MRLLSYRAPDGARLGALLGADRMVDLRDALAAARAAAGEPPGPPLPGDMVAFLWGGDGALADAARALAFAARPDQAALRRPYDAALLLAPVPRPGKILGVGRNYGEHAKEVGGPKQEMPRIFLKPASSVAAPGSLLRIPPAVTKPDWEAELAVVIGRPAWQVEASRALEHVAGYTLLNDVSAREFQFDVAPPQTSFAKGMDGFCPMGPFLVTPEEVGEPWALELRCWLNEELVQHGNTRDLIFPVATLIAHLSRFMTLEPGDVIATGTPAGSGAFRTPPRWLRSGDRLRMEIARIGVLEHGIA